MSLPRTFEGVWFPRELWLLPQSQLKWSAKIILREIISLDGEAGCFAGNEHFVEFSGLNERTVQNVFGVLEARGTYAARSRRRSSASEAYSGCCEPRTTSASAG